MEIENTLQEFGVLFIIHLFFFKSSINLHSNRIRASLWRRLLALQDGVLSRVLAGVLSLDPIAPILTDAHLQALDRRLKTILEQVQVCISKYGIDVIVMDSLPNPR